MGFRAGDSSGSDTSRASQQGNNARIAKVTSQNGEFPDVPQHSNTRESLARAIVRGFRIGRVKKLPEFLERRASPSNAAPGIVVEIKEVLIAPSIRC